MTDEESGTNVKFGDHYCRRHGMGGRGYGNLASFGLLYQKVYSRLLKVGTWTCAPLHVYIDTDLNNVYMCVYIQQRENEREFTCTAQIYVFIRITYIQISIYTHAYM